MTRTDNTPFSRNPGDIFTLTSFLYATIFLSTRLGTLIHEVFGHGLAAILMGGKITKVSIHLFTTGYCGYELPQMAMMGQAFVDMAGIAANLLTGAAALMWAKRDKIPWEARVMLCVFAMISIGSQLVYLVTGTYYGHGDPDIMDRLLGSASWLVWVLGLILMAPGTYVLGKTYLALQEQWAPSHSLKNRCNILLSTLAVASLIYGVCFWAEGRTTGFLGGMAASEQKIAHIAHDTVERLGLDEAEKFSRMEAIKKELTPFPIIAPMLVIVLLSSLAALLNAGHFPAAADRHDFRSQFLWRSLFFALLVGGVIVVLKT